MVDRFSVLLYSNSFQIGVDKSATVQLDFHLHLFHTNVVVIYLVALGIRRC